MAKIRKALVAGAIAGVGALAAGYGQSGRLDAATVGAALGVAVAAALAVWRVPNKPA